MRLVIADVVLGSGNPVGGMVARGCLWFLADMPVPPLRRR